MDFLDIENILAQNKIIPVITVKRLEDTEQILSALTKGGINIAEITLRSDCALNAIKTACQRFPNMLVGAGSVTSKNMAQDAILYGAKFVVSPGFTEEIYSVCKQKNIPYLPGCVTPSEMMNALKFDIKIIKFFPAGLYGGLKALKSLSAPFPMLKFVPTGGVDLTNLSDFLSLDCVAAIGGGFITDSNDFSTILDTAKRAKSIQNNL